MGKKLLVLGVLLAALAAMFPGHAAPAVAFEFNGTVQLPTFPCVPGGCMGSFSGVARGVFEDGHVHINPPAPISFDVTYQENNCAVGNALGSGVIDGIPFTFTWARIERAVAAVGSYGGRNFQMRGLLPFPTFSALSPACMGVAPTSISGTMTGLAFGNLNI